LNKGTLCIRSIKPEQETVVDECRIVDAIRVHDDSANHSAQLDQVMPVTAIARKPGRLDAEDCANVSTADLG